MQQLARWVSILGHPFVMAGILVAVPALRDSSGTAVRSVLLVAVAVLLPLLVLMIRQVRRGRWSNVDASRAADRPALFLVALVGLAVVLAWLWLRDPQSFLVRGVVIVGAFLLVAALLTRWIKLSLHVAFVALTGTSLCRLGSAVGYGLLAAVPVVWWSRLALGRHSMHELLVGLCLGVLTGIALVRL